MTESIGQALPEGQLRPRSPMDHLARKASILAGCVVFLAGLYFVFLYLVSGH
jgi:hypothetical protein